MLTSNVFRVPARDLWQHNVGAIVVASVILADLPLHVVVRKHGVIQGDASLRSVGPSPTLALTLILVLSASVLIRIASTVNVDNALIATTARLSCYLKNTSVCSSLHGGLAQASC